jgi:hypothetical protein
MTLASALTKYGPGTKYNMSVPEVKKMVRLGTEGANRFSQLRKLKNRYKIA